MSNAKNEANLLTEDALFSQYDEVYSVKTSSKQKYCKIIGERLFKLSKGVSDYLQIGEEDIGRNSVPCANLLIKEDKKEFVVIKQARKNSCKFSGNVNSVEIYSAPFAKRIFESLGKTFIASGTVTFTDISFEETETGHPYIIVKYDDYKAAPGVLTDLQTDITKGDN